MYAHVLLEFGVGGTLTSAVLGSGRVDLYHQLKSFLGVVMSRRESSLGTTAFHLCFLMLSYCLHRARIFSMHLHESVTYEIDKPFGAASMVGVQHHFGEERRNSKGIYRSVYALTRIYGHKRWVVTKGQDHGYKRPKWVYSGGWLVLSFIQIQWEAQSLRMSSKLLPRINSSQLGWLRHLFW